jgi:hypothetical protein
MLMSSRMTEPIRGALATVHRLVAQRRPREEVEVALDAATALPESTDPGVAELIALERAEVALRYDASDDDDRKPGERMPVEIIEGIRYTHHLRQMGWPYEETAAVLDEVGTLPAAERCRAQLAFDKIMLTNMYDRPDEDMEPAILAALAAYSTISIVYKASTISTACSGRPALAEKYMPDLIAQVEENMREHPDEVGEKMLEGMRRSLERTRAGLPRP